MTKNRVESPFTETPSHTTVQAMSHTAVLMLCLPKANERLKSPQLGLGLKIDDKIIVWTKVPSIK